MRGENVGVGSVERARRVIILAVYTLEGRRCKYIYSFVHHTSPVATVAFVSVAGERVRRMCVCIVIYCGLLASCLLPRQNGANIGIIASDTIPQRPHQPWVPNTILLLSLPTSGLRHTNFMNS